MTKLIEILLSKFGQKDKYGQKILDTGVVTTLVKTTRDIKRIEVILPEELSNTNPNNVILNPIPVKSQINPKL